MSHQPVPTTTIELLQGTTPKTEEKKKIPQLSRGCPSGGGHPWRLVVRRRLYTEKELRQMSWKELRRCSRVHHLKLTGATRGELIARLLEHMRTQAPLSWPIREPTPVDANQFVVVPTE
jgi:hypothetical protein